MPNHFFLAFVFRIFFCYTHSKEITYVTSWPHDHVSQRARSNHTTTLPIILISAILPHSSSCSFRPYSRIHHQVHFHHTPTFTIMLISTILPYPTSSSFPPYSYIHHQTHFHHTPTFTIHMAKTVSSFVFFLASVCLRCSLFSPPLSHAPIRFGTGCLEIFSRQSLSLHPFDCPLLL